MNPLNRKMFRDPRAARRATGILASSAPLMTAAQKAMAQNEPMRAQTGAAVNTRNRLFDPAQIMRGIQYPLEYFGMPVPESAPGVPVGNALQDLNRFLYGTETRQSPVQSGLRAADEATRRATAQIMEATRRATAQTMGEPLPGVTSENIQAAGRGVVGLFTPQYVGGEMTGPELAAAQAARPESLPSTGLPETSELTGPELAAAQAARPESLPSTGLPETSELTGPELAAAQAAVPSLSPEEAPAEEAPPVSEEAVPGMMRPTSKPARSAKKKVAQEVITPEIVSQLDPTAGLSDMERNQRAKPVGQSVTQKVTDIQSSNLPESKKREKTNEILGIDNLEKEYAVLKEFFGEDRAKDIRTDANYNLMMTGLMIAAGESDNAMINIAKGAAAGLQKYGEAVGEESQEIAAEDKAIKSLVAKTALERREKQEDRTFQELQADRAFGRQVALTGYAADLRGEEAKLAHDRAVEIQDAALAASKANVLAQISSNEKLAQNRLDENIRQFDQNLQVAKDRLSLEPDQLRVFRALQKDKELYSKYAEIQLLGKNPQDQIMGEILSDILTDMEARMAFEDDEGKLNVEKIRGIANVLSETLTMLRPSTTSTSE